MKLYISTVLYHKLKNTESYIAITQIKPEISTILYCQVKKAIRSHLYYITNVLMKLNISTVLLYKLEDTRSLYLLYHHYADDTRILYYLYCKFKRATIVFPMRWWCYMSNVLFYKLEDTRSLCLPISPLCWCIQRSQRSFTAVKESRLLMYHQCADESRCLLYISTCWRIQEACLYNIYCQSSDETRFLHPPELLFGRRNELDFRIPSICIWNHS